MAKKKDFMFRGKTLQEVRALGLNEFAELANARIRRSIKKGFTEAQKCLLMKIKKFKDGKKITKMPQNPRISPKIFFSEI